MLRLSYIRRAFLSEVIRDFIFLPIVFQLGFQVDIFLLFGGGEREGAAFVGDGQKVSEKY